MMKCNNYEVTKKFFNNLKPEDIKKIDTFDSLAAQNKVKPVNTRVEFVYF